VGEQGDADGDGGEKSQGHKSEDHAALAFASWGGRVSCFHGHNVLVLVESHGVTGHSYISSEKSRFPVVSKNIGKPGQSVGLSLSRLKFFASTRGANL
jgi:hypothetical protein